MSDFVNAVVELDAASIEQQVNEDLESKFEGWDPARAGLAAWLIKARARIDSIILEQAGSITRAAYKKFGETIAKVPPILAAPATVASTWAFRDSDGHTIKDGTEVEIPVSGDVTAGFRVVDDVEVSPGETATAAGEVLLQAIEPGVARNGLSDDPVLVSALSLPIESITLEGVTANGVDEEDEDTYLGRLTEELQTLSPSLILLRDFEIDARATAGVARALCIPAYNAEAGKEEALAVTEIGVDAAGASLSAPVKEALKERQEAKLISGVDLYLADPTHTKVDVFPGATALPGFEPATVKGAIGNRLAEYLASANWGASSSGESTGWVNRTKVYFNELISEVDRIDGVDRVVSLLLGGGSGKTFTVAAATDKFSSTAHGFANGDAVVLRTGLTPGAPLAAGTVYYVRDVETNAFKLTATVGGAAIHVTSDGSGTAVKLGTADVTLPGLAPLTEPGEIGVTLV
jgi:Baseplate J-like protein